MWIPLFCRQKPNDMNKTIYAMGVGVFIGAGFTHVTHLVDKERRFNAQVVKCLTSKPSSRDYNCALASLYNKIGMLENGKFNPNLTIETHNGMCDKPGFDPFWFGYVNGERVLRNWYRQDMKFITRFAKTTGVIQTKNENLDHILVHYLGK